MGLTLAGYNGGPDTQCKRGGVRGWGEKVWGPSINKHFQKWKNALRWKAQFMGPGLQNGLKPDLSNRWEVVFGQMRIPLLASLCTFAPLRTLPTDRPLAPLPPSPPPRLHPPFQSLSRCSFSYPSHLPASAASPLLPLLPSFHPLLISLPLSLAYAVPPCSRLSRTSPRTLPTFLSSPRAILPKVVHKKGWQESWWDETTYGVNKESPPISSPARSPP